MKKKNKRYPTPEEFHRLVNKVEKFRAYEKEPITYYQKFFSRLPKKDRVDKFIKYLFSCLLGEPGYECLFLSVSDADEVCTAWINSENYSIEIKDEALERLKKSGWNTFTGCVKYPHGNQGIEKEKNFLFGGLEKLVGYVVCERYENYKETKKP